METNELAAHVGRHADREAARALLAALPQKLPRNPRAASFPFSQALTSDGAPLCQIS